MSKTSTRSPEAGLSPVGRRNLLWLDDAACADLTIPDFFVEAGHVIKERSQRGCRSCPVRLDCLIHAYTGGPSGPITGGYYAGMSPGQRREMSLEQAIEYISNDTPRELPLG